MIQLVVALALLLAGCAGEFGQAPPPAIGPPPPDFRGTWSGTWAGTPLTLVVTEQTVLGPGGGVYLGPLALGQQVPGVLGVMTSTIAGDPVSTAVRGWLGSAGAAVTLFVQARTPDGLQLLALTRVEPDRLVGQGESDFPWGPRGTVELSRRPGA